MKTIKKFSFIILIIAICVSIVICTGCGNSGEGDVDQVTDNISDGDEGDGAPVEEIDLTPELMAGRWNYTRYNQSGCEEYFQIPTMSVNTWEITPIAGNRFLFTDSEVHNGYIEDKKVLIFERNFQPLFSQIQTTQIIMAWQSHPIQALAGYLFSGYGVIYVTDNRTGKQLCNGVYDYLMVKDLEEQVQELSPYNTFNYTCVRAQELRTEFNACMKEKLYYASCSSIDRDAKLAEGQCQQSK